MDNEYFTHLICTGACYIDTILAVPAFPKEDAKQRASSLLRRRGGNCPNTLEVLRQLLPFSSHPLPSAHHNGGTSDLALDAIQAPQIDPLQLFLLTILPAKESADVVFVDESLNHQHSSTSSPSSSTHELKVRTTPPTVDIAHSFHRPSQSQAASSYVIKSLESSSRTIVNYNALDEMTLSEFQTAVTNILATTVDTTSHEPDLTAPSTKPKKIWFHFEGRIPDVTGQCMQWLRHQFPPQQVLSPSSKSSHTDHGPTTAVVDITISTELEHPSRPGLELLAAYADVVFYSRSWAEARGYDGIAACLHGEVERIRAMHDAANTRTEHVDGHNVARDDMPSEAVRLPMKKKTMTTTTLCCTWGEKGAGIVQMHTEPDSTPLPLPPPDDSRPNHIASIIERPAWHPPTEQAIVDTVGAGDTWTAGMLFTFLSADPVVSSWDLARRVDFANELAGRKILREGFGGLGVEMLPSLLLEQEKKEAEADGEEG